MMLWFMLNDFPNSFIINSKVLMNQPVSKVRQFHPLNLTIFIFEICC